MTIPKGQNLERMTKLSSPKLLALQKGDIEIISASALPNAGSRKLSNRFVIATIEPLDLMGKSVAEQRRIIKTVDDLAIRKRIDAIVEATTSDVIRSNDWGLEGTQRLYDAEVVRCVIFDGGHHVGSLQLEPDILLVPITYYRGEPYAGHWFTRDAVPIQKLKRTLDGGEIGSIIVQFPRFGIPIKNRNGMAGVATQAILKAIENSSQDSAVPGEDRFSRPTPDDSSDGPLADSLFISLNADCKVDEDDILKQVEEAIQELGQGAGKSKIEHLYIGLTFGNSKFPHVSERVGLDGEKLEAFLNKHLPYKVSVVSEPLSTWDIYLYRLRAYPQNLTSRRSGGRQE
ncbi:MAG: hypothetical protein IBX64_13425, partial [Actinobacteria bacterium]|nr:hypothetical protein [Actinomycetota bacterium]